MREPLQNKWCSILFYYTNTKSNTSLTASPNHPPSRHPPTQSYVSRIGYSDQALVHTEQYVICKSMRSCRNWNKNETYKSIPADIYITTHTNAKILNINSVSAIQ